MTETKQPSDRSLPRVLRGGLVAEGLGVSFAHRTVLKDVYLRARVRQVTAIIGPSGCGKTTLIRTFNRMHDLVPSARVSGRAFVNGQDIYGPDADPVRVRRKVGMVFQRANVFPTMSIYENVSVGLRLNGNPRREELDAAVEVSLNQAALWDEVKDRLRQPATTLSGGQQQRLCISRALAVQPEVLLFDEPCSALDPVATEKIEELLFHLRQHYTIVIVTHNMQQAARVSDETGFMLLGEMVEYGPTDDLFTNPRDPRTEAYLTGRFG